MRLPVMTTSPRSSPRPCRARWSAIQATASKGCPIACAPLPSPTALPLMVATPRTAARSSALEYERKQVTVLFADLKGSMGLLGDRGPEEARKILDPVLELMIEAV